MFKFLLYSLIFFVSFTDAFALSGWFKLWVIIVFLILPVSIIKILSKKKISVGCYVKEDILILVLFSGLILSTFVNFHDRSFNYLLAYIFVFGIFYLYLKLVFTNFSVYYKILAINSYAVILVASFSLFDFVLWYYFNFDIQSYIPRSRETGAIYLGMFRRSYGFATEPTILAFYFNTLGVIGVWYLWHRLNFTVFFKIVCTTICFLGWLFTFSGVAIPALPLCILVSLLLIKFKYLVKIRQKHLIYGIIGLFLISVVYLPYKNQVNAFLKPIFLKFTLQEQYKEYGRVQKWKHDLSLISSSPFLGHGLGFTSDTERGSSINWYIFLTLEAGIISSLPVILFLLFSYLRIYNSKIPGKIWFMSAFMAGSVHLFAISTFFHPFLWMLLTIFFTYHNQWSLKNSIENQHIFSKPKRSISVSLRKEGYNVV